MASGLAPLSSKGKTSSDKAKTDHHVPGSDMWDWVQGARDIEDNNPEQADKEVRHHDRGEPTWALLGHKGSVFCNVDLVMVLFADLFAHFGFRHRGRLLQNYGLPAVQIRRE